MIMTDTALLAPEAPDMDQMLVKASQAAELLKALSHEHRLLLLCLLAEKERSVGELESLLSLRQPAVSQQLARLRDDDLVTARRDGKTIYYSLASDNVRRIIQVIYDIYCSDAAK
jgi:DNA-binding transcriptional ArsR family regulator